MTQGIAHERTDLILPRNKRAFTIVGLLVVIAILGTLIGFVRRRIEPMP